LTEEFSYAAHQYGYDDGCIKTNPRRSNVPVFVSAALRNDSRCMIQDSGPLDCLTLSVRLNTPEGLNPSSKTLGRVCRNTSRHKVLNVSRAWNAQQ